MSIANSSSCLGFTNDRTTPGSEHALGTVVIGGGTDYIYLKATGGAIAAAGTFAPSGTGTTSGSTYTHDVPAPGVALNGFFWAKKVTSPF